MIADIAFVFHWPLSDMLGMTIGELAEWQERSARRYGEHLKAIMSPWTKS